MCFQEIPIFNAKSVDPDQTPQNAASDPGLYYLPVSLLWDARHKWVNSENLRILICTLPELFKVGNIIANSGSLKPRHNLLLLFMRSFPRTIFMDSET